MTAREFSIRQARFIEWQPGNVVLNDDGRPALLTHDSPHENKLEGLNRNHTETAFVLMLIAIFVGTVIDDLGTRIESRWLIAGRERRTGGLHGEEWWAYLQKPFAAEPSGRRHF